MEVSYLPNQYWPTLLKPFLVYGFLQQFNDLLRQLVLLVRPTLTHYRQSPYVVLHFNNVSQLDFLLISLLQRILEVLLRYLQQRLAQFHTLPIVAFLQEQSSEHHRSMGLITTLPPHILIQRKRLQLSNSLSFPDIAQVNITRSEDTRDLEPFRYL